MPHCGPLEAAQEMRPPLAPGRGSRCGFFSSAVDGRACLGSGNPRLGSSPRAYWTVRDLSWGSPLSGLNPPTLVPHTHPQNRESQAPNAAPQKEPCFFLSTHSLPRHRPRMTSPIQIPKMLLCAPRAGVNSDAVQFCVGPHLEPRVRRPSSPSRSPGSAPTE